METTGPPDSKFSVWQRARSFVSALAGLFFVGLLIEIACRVSFPWDLLVWSESPFMTNMLKLHQGQPLFTDPQQANSFVYAPGLEFITYGLLSPLGLELDIRYCRAISVVLGLLAALATSLAAVNIGQAEDDHSASLPLRMVCFFLFALVIFKNFTADVPHPDNLHMLHFGLTFLMAQQALARQSLRMAMLTVVIAGLAVCCKQNAAIAVVGVIAAFIAGRRWSGRANAALAGIGIGVLLLSLAVMLTPDLSRYYLLELLSRHSIDLSKITYLVRDVMLMPHRLMLLLGAAIAVRHYWLPDQKLRPYFILWIALGITEVAPSLLAYFKALGVWNNLGIVDLWLLLGLAPAVPGCLCGAPQGSAPARCWVVYSAALTLAFVPLKMPPPSGLWQYCEAIQQSVTADVQEGRRVLVGHGTMFQIHAGDDSVPLDRANSLLELWHGQAIEQAGTQARIADRYYGRIYLNSEWYAPEIVAEMERNYTVTNKIPQADSPYGRICGFQPRLTRKVNVLTPNEP